MLEKILLCVLQSRTHFLGRLFPEKRFIRNNTHTYQISSKQNESTCLHPSYTLCSDHTERCTVGEQQSVDCEPGIAQIIQYKPLHSCSNQTRPFLADN
jgi:hypothetical protein